MPITVRGRAIAKGSTHILVAIWEFWLLLVRYWFRYEIQESAKQRPPYTSCWSVANLYQLFFYINETDMYSAVFSTKAIEDSSWGISFQDRFSWSVMANSVQGSIRQDASTVTRELSTRENGCQAKIAREYKHESSHVVTQLPLDVIAAIFLSPYRKLFINLFC